MYILPPNILYKENTTNSTYFEMRKKRTGDGTPFIEIYCNSGDEDKRIAELEICIELVSMKSIDRGRMPFSDFKKCLIRKDFDEGYKQKDIDTFSETPDWPKSMIVQFALPDHTGDRRTGHENYFPCACSLEDICHYLSMHCAPFAKKTTILWPVYHTKSLFSRTKEELVDSESFPRLKESDKRYLKHPKK
ncbi:hypothetical protein M501DRAFT_989286 [Patellaria atrata CBS 101060]|uniref:Uncharacterized protein n=1 Tax=Patellaria atrata CBS 101060 TaxID=1346257 RepID=A0A9P4S3A2_9PEZI|nr:hypothetical protein M501DRAFT_989286 [Patellaria atrata CBS 101060]